METATAEIAAVNRERHLIFGGGSNNNKNPNKNPTHPPQQNQTKPNQIKTKTFLFEVNENCGPHSQTVEFHQTCDTEMQMLNITAH